ncbi:helix-turn-helix transcriptional regulator [Longitalea arenae]|uniref:helix-turn-helix transcriptional regulator n=1 Tax=Longitalea arenae TaxID=2812558 RepID=UPI0019675153|nr:helix-turn-helix transcriptional regulator [Longitalea arenae]
MGYKQYKPDPALAPYIDAYWKVTNTKGQAVVNRIMPDGCVDILINTGEDLCTEKDGFILKNGAVGLVGTMTRFKDIVQPADTSLLGVRFKPAAFSFFYNYASLHELTNTTVEFEKELVPEITSTKGHFVQAFDRFFLSRMAAPKQSILPVITSINNCKGHITVDALARLHFISKRQLERHFKQQTGLSPKAFINFVRFELAFKNIKKFHSQKSLLEIAFDSGYYDHAHLSNDIKRYTGLAPSQL